MSNIELLNNIHPLIKAVGEAIADPPSYFFMRRSKSLREMWEIFLNPDCKNDYDENKIKFIAAFDNYDKAEDSCEKLNQYNLAKYALKAYYNISQSNYGIVSAYVELEKIAKE